MSILFEETNINKMKIPNRLVRSATWEGLASDEGEVTDKLVDLIEKLAAGGVGMIISGHAYVQPEGKIGPGQMGIYSDQLLDGLVKMTSAAHRHDRPILAQLSHAGVFANHRLTGLTVYSPSLPGKNDGITRKCFDLDDIQATIEAFSKAALRAKQAGFDGVQIHAAHGYLLSQFLSPAFNRRTDAYGGSITGRAKILKEIIENVRQVVGQDYPILVKLNSEDFLDKGLSKTDALEVGVMLEKIGIDALEVSGGTRISDKLIPPRIGINRPEKEAYFKDAAKAFKEQLSIPIILVGGIRSFEVCEDLINGSYADYISMSRPLIREPHLPNRWASGDTQKAACLSDNLCFKPAFAKQGIYCVVEKRKLQD
jgi:2,4-dienoyl-CoA reductase-like NADH-dependent reductase (Old Yellow Enzyme family)